MNAKAIRSIEHLLDTLYYMAQVKTLADLNGVNIYLQNADKNLVAVNFVETQFSPDEHYAYTNIRENFIKVFGDLQTVVGIN